MLNQLSAECITESRTDPDCSGETALREIETARAARSICNYEDRNDDKDGIRNAVKDLNRDEASRVVSQGVENCAHRKHSKADHQ